MKDSKVTYQYEAEKMVGGDILSLYRHGSDGSYEEFDWGEKKWVQSVNALDAFHGYIYTMGVTEEQAMEETGGIC